MKLENLITTFIRCKQPREKALFSATVEAKVRKSTPFAQRMSFLWACTALTSCQCLLGISTLWIYLIFYFIFPNHYKYTRFRFFQWFPIPPLFLPKIFGAVPVALISTGINVTVRFHNFFTSLARSKYFSLFSFFFYFSLQHSERSAKTAKSTWQVIFFICTRYIFQARI